LELEGSRKECGALTVTEHEELFALASSDLGQKGQQVVRNPLRVLTHDATGVSPSGVEVAQQSTVPLLSLSLVSGLAGIITLGVDHINDGVLDGELGVAVGVSGAQRALLGDGDHVGEAGGITVDGGRAGEDNVVDIVADHGAQKVQSAVDVDIVVVQRLLTGLTNGLSSKAQM
jgi:hypothetical protein